MAKRDKFTLNQCPENGFEEEKVEDSLCINSRKSNVCLDLYTTRYCVHYLNVEAYI